MENLKKTELVKIAKDNKLRGYSKFNKQNLIEFLESNLESLNLNESPEVLVSDLKLDGLTVSTVPERIINPVPERIINPVPAKKLNPVQELNTKIQELRDNPNSIREIENLRHCYAYRIWLWNNYNQTWEDVIKSFK